MKVIDTRTKKTNENYKCGDILMCWIADPNECDLFRISLFYDKYNAQDRYIGVIIHNSGDNEEKSWPGIFDSVEEMVTDIKNSYPHVEKVNAHIVITD